MDGHLPVIPRPRVFHQGFQQPLALCMRKKTSKSLSLPESEPFQKFTMGAIHKMVPVGVCGALLHTGLCWMYGWLSVAEKNSPLESYVLLLLLEYAYGHTYRRSLCSKNLKNQTRERLRARFFLFFRIDDK